MKYLILVLQIVLVMQLWGLANDVSKIPAILSKATAMQTADEAVASIQYADCNYDNWTNDAFVSPECDAWQEKMLQGSMVADVSKEYYESGCNGKKCLILLFKSNDLKIPEGIFFNGKEIVGVKEGLLLIKYEDDSHLDGVLGIKCPGYTNPHGIVVPKLAEGRVQLVRAGCTTYQIVNGSSPYEARILFDL